MAKDCPSNTLCRRAYDDGNVTGWDVREWRPLKKVSTVNSAGKFTDISGNEFTTACGSKLENNEICAEMGPAASGKEFIDPNVAQKRNCKSNTCILEKDVS